MAVVALAVAPVLFNPWGFDPGALPKLVVLWVAAPIGAIAALVRGRVPLTRATVVLAVYVLWMFLSAMLAESPRTAVVGSASRHMGAVTWLLIAAALLCGCSWSAKGDRRRLALLVVLASVPVAAYAVLQRVGIDPFFPHEGSVRPGSTFASASFLGGYLAVATVIAATWALTERSQRLWLLPVMALDGAALLLSESRGAWVGAVAGISVAGIVANWRRLLGRRELIGVAAGLVCATVAALGLPGVADRAATLASPGEGTAAGRVELWQTAVRAVGDEPLLGWGPDESRPAMQRNLPEGFERRFGDERVEDRAHNVLLDVAVWGGAIGMLLLAATVALVGRASARAATDGVSLAVACGLVAFCGHWMFNFPDPALDPLAAMLAGSLIAGAPGTRPVRVPSILGGFAAATVVIVASLASVDAVSADRSARVGVDAENRGDLTTAENAYLDARAAQPSSARYAELLTRFYLRAGHADLAVEVAADATELDPSDPYLAELHATALATASLADGNPTSATEAEQILLSLIADAPHDGSLLLALGTALAAQGRLDEAADAYATSARMLPRRSEPTRNLGLLAEQRGDVQTAIDYLRQAVAINPDDQTAIAALQRLQNQP